MLSGARKPSYVTELYNSIFRALFIKKGVHRGSRISAIIKLFLNKFYPVCQSRMKIPTSFTVYDRPTNLRIADKRTGLRYGPSLI